MTVKKNNINIAFEEPTAGLLAKLAHQQHKTIADLVKELTIEALEQREDFYLSQLADKLDQPDVKTYSHEDAWK
jgi:predicted DNA-binding protein